MTEKELIKEIEELKKEIENTFIRKTIEKNEGRSKYFLSLTLDESLGIIDEIFSKELKK